ncbi:MAG: hypothetical protein QOD77_942 [Thermoplasmata archaeon]|nr:hypothetical protein [Thermoplasmata archaeon]
MAVPLSKLRRRRVVVLPDLYIDALAPLPAWGETGARLHEIAGRGGGNLPIGPVHLKLGGNAANLALALARLGAQVELIAETDALGARLLQQAAKGTKLGTSRVRTGKRSSVTLGLECADANVMLSHAGPLADFGPRRLQEEDWALMEEADAVAVVNWSQNAHGTPLLRTVADRLGRHGTFVYLDTGDPRHRAADAQQLVRPGPLWRGVGSFGMNENELAAYAGTEAGRDPMGAAAELSERLGVRLDVHTRQWAASVGPDGAVTVPASATPGRRLTGAGDAWNAGNLAGQLLAVPDRDRLRLAHRVATKYVTSASGLPPTARQVA